MARFILELDTGGYTVVDTGDRGLFTLTSEHPTLAAAELALYGPDWPTLPEHQKRAIRRNEGRS